MDEAARRRLKAGALAGGEAAREAFRLLWTAFRPRLVAFARAWRAIGPAGAEDAASEALIGAFRGLARYDPERPLEPWVWVLAARRYADLARAQARHPERPFAEGEVEALIAPDQDAAESLSRSDQAERARRAIAALPEAERRMAILVFCEGLSSKEAGAALSMPAGTVRWRVSLLRRHLRAALGEQEHERVG